MNGFVVVDVGMCPILFLHQWVVDVQLLGHSPDVVLLVVANVDVIANVANGDVGLDGYVHTIAIAILNVVDLDVDLLPHSMLSMYFLLCVFCHSA